MKLFKVLEKNFKVLFRKKTSLFTIFFGPLFVILLMSAAFSTTTTMQISLGYLAPDDSVLTQEFVANLNDKYLAKEFYERDECVRDLEQGLIHACIIFPENFEIENDKTNDITFIVDKSRISLVYSVIEDISTNIDVKTDELSKDLTEKILSTLTTTNEELDKSLASIILAKATLSSSKTDVNDMTSDIADLGDSTGDIGLATLPADLDILHAFTSDLYDEIQVAVDDCSSYLGEIDNFDLASGENETEFLELIDDVNDELSDLEDLAHDNENSSAAKVLAMSALATSASEKIAKIEELSTTQSGQLTTLKTNINNIIANLDSIKSNIETIQNNINNIQVTSSDNIVNPITTSIETVSSEDNKLALIFPYILMLLIMFTSLILSSTLVVVEKQSNAAFRTFTTPTRDEFFIMTTFLTSFIIMMMQLLVILAAVSYFMFDLLLSNPYINLLLLILGTSLFIFIGMALGYLLKSQQATNMATIFVGTVFLFLSNIVFPLESIAPQLKYIAQYNPFVLTSELLRKSILFTISFDKILVDLAILFGYSLLFLILIIIFQKLAKVNYFKKVARFRSKVNRFIPISMFIGDKEVKTEKELLKQLKNIDDEEYIKIITENVNQFKDFIEISLNERRIGNLKKITRSKLILILEKRLKIADKQVEKQEAKDKKKKEKKKEPKKETHILNLDNPHKSELEIREPSEDEDEETESNNNKQIDD